MQYNNSPDFWCFYCVIRTLWADKEEGQTRRTAERGVCIFYTKRPFKYFFLLVDEVVCIYQNNNFFLDSFFFFLIHIDDLCIDIYITCVSYMMVGIKACLSTLCRQSYLWVKMCERDTFIFWFVQQVEWCFYKWNQK